MFGPQKRKRAEKEKGQNIGSSEEKKTRDRKGTKIFGEGKYLWTENIWSAVEMKNGEGKGGNYSEKEN